METHTGGTVPVSVSDLAVLLDAARDQTGWVGFEGVIKRVEELLREAQKVGD